MHLPTEDDIDPNAHRLHVGAERLGLGTGLLPRNAKDCTNLGVCGMGCPTDAKQTAKHTYLESARRKGTVVWCDARATRLEFDRKRRVRAVHVAPLDRATRTPLGKTALRVTADHVVLAGSAINTPRLLLQSGLRSKPLGRRTWLHPVVGMVAEFEEEIRPWEGSPQSVGVFEFSDRADRMGFVIETPPVHPVLAAVGMPWLGQDHVEWMKRLAHLQVVGAFLIDGFAPCEPGGRVTARRGHVHLSYPFTEHLREGALEAMRVMARIQFAAGARKVRTLHTEPLEFTSPDQLERLSSAPFQPCTQATFSAHQLGGCPMGEDQRRAVVDSRGRAHQIQNLSVHDASVFPTGLGVNPMLTVYAVASLFTDALIQQT